MMNGKIRISSLIRWIVLGIILIGSMVIHYLHLNGGAQYPSVHAICPYGGIENLWEWLRGQANISKIFSGTMVLFFLTAVLAIVSRRSFCGNICPFGALQEFLGFLVPKKFRVPEKIDRVLRKTKYVILVVSLGMAWYTATLWLSPFDPWAAFAHMYKGEELLNEYLIGTILLVVVIIASLFNKRFFCKYMCPAGAMYGIIGKISPFKMERNEKTCTNCKVCTNKCPMDIEVHKMNKVTTAECISCARCVDVCPAKSGTMAPKAAGYSVKPLIVVLSTIVIFFGSIWVLNAAGLYTVSIPTQEEIEQEQNYIPIRDIRGSMTIEQGAFYTGKDLDEFYSIMEIPKSVPKETLLKSVVMYVPGYDFHAMKAAKGSE